MLGEAIHLPVFGAATRLFLAATMANIAKINPLGVSFDPSTIPMRTSKRSSKYLCAVQTPAAMAKSGRPDDGKSRWTDRAAQSDFVPDQFFGEEEPCRPDAIVHDFVDGHCVVCLRTRAGDALVIDDLVANDHPVDQFGVKMRQPETIGVVLGKRLLARDRRQCIRRTEDPHVIGVLGDKTLNIVCVVGVKLALDRRSRVHARLGT